MRPYWIIGVDRGDTAENGQYIIVRLRLKTTEPPFYDDVDFALLPDLADALIGALCYQGEQAEALRAQAGRPN
jgi:hypothetical protein